MAPYPRRSARKRVQAPAVPKAPSGPRLYYTIEIRQIYDGRWCVEMPGLFPGHPGFTFYGESEFECLCKLIAAAFPGK